MQSLFELSEVNFLKQNAAKYNSYECIHDSIKENSEILGNGKHLLDKLKGALRAYKNNLGGSFRLL